MRDLETVMNELERIAPELIVPFRKVRFNIGFTAPEAMSNRWLEVQMILVDKCSNHSKFKLLKKIWNKE